MSVFSDSSWCVGGGKDKAEGHGAICDGEAGEMEERFRTASADYPGSEASGKDLAHEGVWKDMLSEKRLYQL